MGDPQDKKSKNILSWQREESSPQPTSSEERFAPSTSSSDETQSSLPRAALIDQATKFLDEDDVKTAPTERKIRFLQTKGLTEEEIYQLLNLSADDNHSPDVEEQPNTSSQSPSQPNPPTSSSKDTVPIITYPEFLLHTQKPPPLITTSRLLSAFYILASTSATLYGTNKYLITPMLDSLSASRHSLFSTALDNLSTLNSKLSSIISQPSTSSSAQNRANAESDINSSPLSPSTSSNDDISPMFSRTIGTQTSPQPSSSPSHPTTPPPPVISATASQESKLRTLHTTLSSLLPSKQDDALDVQPSEKMRELRSYLDGLVYPGLGLGWGSGLGSGVIVKGDDAVGRVKADVRGVKGVLLNARNFPGVR
ncbi:MAG: hypothetical protein LQ342_007286 [Letrouitia transgressa]|nr:MAG: hypothetical protein LQ342_007286 [Letrouitia transgressa]